MINTESLQTHILKYDIDQVYSFIVKDTANSKTTPFSHECKQKQYHSGVFIIISIKSCPFFNLLFLLIVALTFVEQFIFELNYKLLSVISFFFAVSSNI